VPLGLGPVLDPQVFNKFAELDKTKNKRYLDWMLFQAGGGQEAFNNSRELWGDTSPEKKPEELFAEFHRQKPDTTVYSDELNAIIQELKINKGIDAPRLRDVSEEIQEITALPNINRRFKALQKLLETRGVVPGSEKNVAVEIISHKFKVWMRHQLAVKHRDRVHSTLVYIRSIKGISRAQSEAKWKEAQSRLRQAFILGDQDQREFNTFSFVRHWPGPKGSYEQIYNTMRQFLLNVSQVERHNERIELYNARVAAANKAAGPGQQLPLWHPMNINVDIGKVLVDKEGNLTYKGPYATVYDLAQANEKIAELPAKERVAQDVRYADPKGTWSKTSKIYSDANLDVTVPLNVAAAVHGGHPSWPISDPRQITDLKGQGVSTWTQHAIGQHGHMEWEGTPAVTVFFNVKIPDIPENFKKIMMTVFLDDLANLEDPYTTSIWRVSGNPAELTFEQLMELLRKSVDDAKKQIKPGTVPPDLRRIYFSFGRSFVKAIDAIKKWGAQFDPRNIVADYTKAKTRYRIGEDIKIRAAQVVELLSE
jgi:hypothetical protein